MRLSAATPGAQARGSGTSEVEILRKEIDHLRQRLTSSELLRHRGQAALQELKEEFETLHFDLMHHGDDGTAVAVPALSVHTADINE